MTVADLDRSLRFHALISRPRGLSYEEAAKLVGDFVIAALLFWWLLGFPSSEAAHAWWWTHIVSHEQSIVIVLATAGCGSALAFLVAEDWRCPAALGVFLRAPVALIARTIEASRLLLGIATIGAVAIVPGAYVVFLLGLNGR